MARRKSAAVVRREIARIYNEQLPKLKMEEYAFFLGFHYGIDWLFGLRTRGAVDAVLDWRERGESDFYLVFNSRRLAEFYTENHSDFYAMSLFRAMCENEMAQAGPPDFRVQAQNRQILNQYFVQHFGEDAEWRGG